MYDTNINILNETGEEKQLDCKSIKIKFPSNISKNFFYSFENFALVIEAYILLIKC